MGQGKPVGQMCSQKGQAGEEDLCMPHCPTAPTCPHLNLILSPYNPTLQINCPDSPVLILLTFCRWEIWLCHIDGGFSGVSLAGYTKPSWYFFKFVCVNEGSNHPLRCVTKHRDMQSTKPGWPELQLSAEKQTVCIMGMGLQGWGGSATFQEHPYLILQVALPSEPPIKT